MSTRRIVGQGLVWTFGHQVFSQLIKLLLLVVLARLLMPAAFGLIGMVGVFLAMGRTVADAGLSASLIRTKEPDDLDFSTVFWMNLGLSLAMYGLLWLMAPLIADFFRQPILMQVTRILGLGFLMESWVAVHLARYTKKFDFRTPFFIRMPSLVAGGTVGIAMANLGYGVWSLVGMQLVQSFLYALQLWVRSGWRPSLYFSKARVRYHGSFGAGLALSALLDVFFRHVYIIIIGRFFSPLQLGYYTRAQSLQQLSVVNTLNALNQVTYPMLAGMQQQPQQLQKACRLLMRQVFFGIAPLMVAAVVLAEPLFRLVLTAKWLPAVFYFQIFCIVGFMYPLHELNLQMLKVKGRTDLILVLEVIKKTLIIISILLALPYGIEGLLWSQVAITLVSFFINTLFNGRLMLYPLQMQVRDLWPIALLSIGAGALVWLTDHLLFASRGSDALRLLTGGGMYAMLYLAAAQGCRLPAWLEYRNIWKQLRVARSAGVPMRKWLDI